MRGLFLLIFFVNLIFSEKFTLFIKNIEKDYEFKNLQISLVPLYRNAEFEYKEYILEELKPLEEKRIILYYEFINPKDDKLLIEIKENGIPLFKKIYDLKYKGKLKNSEFNFYFSKNIFNFYFPREGILKIKIFDVSGRKIYSKEEKVKSGIFKKDFSFLKPGNYFYEIEFDKKYTGKFVILKGGKR